MYRGRRYDWPDDDPPTDEYGASVCAYFGDFTGDYPDWVLHGVTMRYVSSAYVGIYFDVGINDDLVFSSVGVEGNAIISENVDQIDCYEATDGLVVDVTLLQSGVLDPYSSTRSCYASAGKLICVNDRLYPEYDGFDWTTVSVGDTISLTYSGGTVVVTIASVQDVVILGEHFASIETDEALPGDFPTAYDPDCKATYVFPKGIATLNVIE